MKIRQCLWLLTPVLLYSQAQDSPPPARPPRVVPPARITTFTVNPASVKAGQPVVLTWATENPNGVSIEPSVGRVAARGTRQVIPVSTTTYTLTAGGPNNTSVTQAVNVTVIGAGAPAQAQPSAAEEARMPDGKPDFTGVYGFAGVRGATPPVLKPGAEKFRIIRGPNEIRGNTTLGPDCVPLGVPQSFVTPYPFQIVQNAKFILMVFEYPNTFRFIPTDGRPHPADPDPTWMGDATGHWDGDTLVVDTIGFNDKTEVSGYMHTEAFHVMERYRRVATGLEYDVTVEDPNVFAKPWTLPTRVLPFRPDLEKVDEYVCENKVDYGKYFEKK